MNVDIWAARSGAQVFDRIGVDYPRTPKTGEPSFTQNWLINCNNPVAQLIRQAREINKFHSSLKCGNNITSLIDGESVSSITSLSIPRPAPAVGGKPYDKAST